MVRAGIEDYGPACLRIRVELASRIARSDVTVVEARHDESTPTVRSPDHVFVYSDDAHTVQGLGTPLMFAVTCQDQSAWRRIDAVLEQAGYVPYGPRGAAGTQAYKSTERAWFIVPEHPGATMAVQMTGKAVLGWIASA